MKPYFILLMSWVLFMALIVLVDPFMEKLNPLIYFFTIGLWLFTVVLYVAYEEISQQRCHKQTKSTRGKEII